MHFFDYSAPTSLDEACGLLAKYGDELRPLAGGTDLLPQIRAGKFAPQMVMDVKRIPELVAVRYEADKVVVGAGVSCAELYEDDKFARMFPGLIDCLTIVGGIQIQSRAGFGGNLCNSSPSADTICPLIVHSARAVLVSAAGTRTVAVGDFCTAPGENVMKAEEMLLAIEIPTASAEFGAAYQRFTPRNEMDIAVAGVAVAVKLDAELKKFEQIKIALAGVAPTPLLAVQAMAKLQSADVSAQNISGAGATAATEIKPIDDMRGSIPHRRQLIATLVGRVTEAAIADYKTRVAGG